MEDGFWSLGSVGDFLADGKLMKELERMRDEFPSRGMDGRPPYRRKKIIEIRVSVEMIGGGINMIFSLLDCLVIMEKSKSCWN